MKKPTKPPRQRRITRREFVERTLAAAAVWTGAPTLLRGRNLNNKLNTTYDGYVRGHVYQCKKYGLHPSCPELAALFSTVPAGATASKAAILANVGMLVQPVPDKATYNTWATGGSNLPVNLFSHSDQQSAWQGLIPNASLRTPRSRPWA